MAKPVSSKRNTDGGNAANMPVKVEPSSHEEIAHVAFRCWEARGCPIGSPEEDWFRAELELRCTEEQPRKPAHAVIPPRPLVKRTSAGSA